MSGRVSLDDFNAIPAPDGGDRPFRVWTGRELCALPEPDEADMLLGPLLTRAGRTIIVADTGHGKTSLALQLGAAVLSGAEMFGYRGAGVGPLLVVDCEQGRRSIKRGLRDTQLDERDDAHYVSVPDGLALDADEREREALEQLVDELRPAVLILDPFYKAHRGDANEERAVVDLMRYLDRLRAEYGFALILPAHPRKDAGSNGARKLTLHDVAGSGAVTRGAELVLALERLSHGYARLRILKDRDFDLPVGDTWPLLFTRGEGFRLDPKEEQTVEELEQRILADGAGEWRTYKEWAAELRIRSIRAQELLEGLLAAGRVEFAEGPPGRQHNARCYRAAVPAAWERQGTAASDAPEPGAVPAAPAVIGTAGAAAAAGVVPVAGNSTGTAPSAPGDDGFLDFIAALHRADHITTGEALHRERLRTLILRAQEARRA